MAEKRSQINIRLSEEELQKVKLSAEVKGLSVGRYAKQVLLKSKLVEPKMSAKMFQEINRQIIGIANNVNQLTRVANSSSKVEMEAVNELRKEVQQLWQQLAK